MLSRARQFVHAHAGLAWAATATVLSYLLFVLPYAFPPPARPRLVSPSYEFGFNNKVAVVSLAAFVLIQSLWQRISGSGLFCGAFPERKQRLDRTLVGLYFTAALWYLVLTATMYFAVAKPDGYYKLDWESSHFIWHVRMMDSYGLKPYRDFVMEYGPAFMYLPAWGYAALRPFGISLDGSYYTVHYLLNLLGLAALVYLVNSLAIAPRYKKVAFALVAVSAFSLPMGLSGVLVRYLLPYAGLLLVHRANVRNGASQGRWRLMAAVFGASLAVIVISPEITLALLAAVTVYAVLLYPRNRAAAGYILFSEATVAGLSLLLLPTGYFSSVISFSRGANNLPIAPDVHIVFYVAIVLLCIPRLLASRILEDSPGAAYASAVGIASLAMVPVALGRCDASHVCLNGLGLFIVGFGLFGRSGKRWFTTYSIGYALVVILFFQWSTARFYGISTSRLEAGLHRIADSLTGLARRGDRNPVAPASAQPQKAAAITAAPKPVFAEFDKYRALGLPYGSYGYEKSLQRYLWSEKRVVPERYMGSMCVYDEAQLQERLAEISRIAVLVIQKNFLKFYEHRDLCKEHEGYIRTGLFTFKSRPCVNQPLDPNIDIARFIDSHYHQIEQIRDYLIMKRNDSAIAGSAQ
jgi:hypothetical protein